MDIKNLLEKLEPEQATTKDASPVEDLTLMSLTSMAVSLKRIADIADAWWDRHTERHP